MADEIVRKALSSIGKGFDLTSDFRLKFCKGKDRLVLLNESENKTLTIPNFGSYNGVSVDIKSDKGDQTRFQSDILTFNQMSEFVNQKSSVEGKIPSGLFNWVFGYESGSWATDAGNTKYMGVDVYFVKLFSLHIDRYPLLLSGEVRRAVPATWDPLALARFIEKFGTHVIVGLSIGGQHVVAVRQDQSSNLEPSELKKHLNELGNQLFTGTCSFTPLRQDIKLKVPKAFDLLDPSKSISFDSFSSVSTKDGITVISSKKGGASTGFHSEWQLSVPSMPDAIHFSFIPITSLLNGDPGKGFLSHAINLYLRYKPPIEELAYFLDFQIHKNWAPILNELPLGPATIRAKHSPSLNLNFMGPKLYVNLTKVIIGKRPVTGMKLYLEGKKFNRLAIHLQHLLHTPKMMENIIDDTSFWQGSENITNNQYIEPITGKKYAYVSTQPVKYNPEWTTKSDVVFIVTGAQLQVEKHDEENVLHLRLLFSMVSNALILKSCWQQGSSEFSPKSGIFSAIGTWISSNVGRDKGEVVVVDSSVFPAGPPAPMRAQRLLKFVDMAEVCKEAKDFPGYWLVTGAKLDLEKGKICLRVKFSLVNYCT